MPEANGNAKSSVESILISTSFSALDDAGQSAVRELYASYNDGKPLNVDHLPLFRNRESLAVTLEHSSYKLANYSPDMFKFLNEDQRKALARELLFAFYLFSAQYQLDDSEGRRQALKSRSEQIKMCASYLDQLQSTDALGSKEGPQSMLDKAINDSEKHAKYLGLTIVAPMIVEKMFEFATGELPTVKEWKGANKSGAVVGWMTDVNGRRLYWVWGGGLLNSIISMLPDDFANKPQAQKAVSSPSPVTGYMSWILYYARFGINLFLLLKHTFKGPWMSQKERQVPAWERFKTQWKQRKFALLNDSIWGVANMACFFWLIGSGVAGYFGNVATFGLLLMDTFLTALRFCEESTQNNNDMERFRRDIAILDQKIKEDDKNKASLEIERDNLIEARDRCKFNWDYKKYSLINDLVYATSLMLAFGLMCCFFFPPAMIVPATAMILGVTGAALSFVLTAVSTAMTSGLDISKSHKIIKKSKHDAEKWLEKFKELKSQKNEDENDFVKKQLYLKMKGLMATSKDESRRVQYQTLQLVRGVLVDALLPPLIFVSFMFLPFGIGLGVLAAGFALGMLARIILAQFEPKGSGLCEMNEASYERFAALPNPTLKDLNDDKKAKKQGFFPERASDSSSPPPPYDGLDFA